MSLVNATTAEIAQVQRQLEALRTELMRHAHAGVNQAGFTKADEVALSCIMSLLGAAQRYSLMSRQHYAIFKALCHDYSLSEADAVVQRSVMEMGDEMNEPDIAPSIIRPYNA